MKKTIRTGIIISLAVLLGACGSTPKDEIKNSGFLSDYSLLKEAESTDDNVVMRWESKILKSRGYTKVMIDEVSFYPAPKASDKLPIDVLSSIVNYSNKSIMDSAGKTGKLVSTSEEGTVRLKMAITGASIDDQGLSGINYLPIAFIASAATGNLDNLAAKLVIEGELTDANTGELLSTFVRTGIGAEVDDEKQLMTLDMVKPVIDGWAELVKQGINANLK